MYRRIRDLREDNDYSQDYISKLLGCSRSNYAMYESGDVKITIKQLSKLADIYNISIDYLLGMTDSKILKTEFIRYDKEKLIHNIRTLRIENNLNQSFLAEHVLNCTQASYSQYETGKRSINIDAIIILSRFYKVSIDILIGRIESPTLYKYKK